MAGMGLLPLATHFEEEKVLTRVEGAFGELDGIFAPMSGMEVSGYEIHMGRTEISGGRGPEDTAKLTDYRQEPEICRPLAYLMETQGDSKRAGADGWNRGNVYGGYLHGIFDGSQAAPVLAGILAKQKGMELKTPQKEDYQAYRQAQYDELAGELRKSLDMEQIYAMMGLERNGQKDGGRKK